MCRLVVCSFDAALFFDAVRLMEPRCSGAIYGEVREFRPQNQTVTSFGARTICRCDEPTKQFVQRLERSWWRGVKITRTGTASLMRGRTPSIEFSKADGNVCSSDA